MKDDRKRGIEPTVSAPTGMTADLLDIYDSWPPRFRAKVDIGSGCWTWTACRDSRGYGRYGTTRERNAVSAHRMSVELTTGQEPPLGMHVDHLCRNPSCVRPDHLEVVEHGENIRRGLPANSSGWCRAGLHEWVEENITTTPNGSRHCTPCRKERDRKRQQRIRAGIREQEESV